MGSLVVTEAVSPPHFVQHGVFGVVVDVEDFNEPVVDPAMDDLKTSFLCFMCLGLGVALDPLPGTWTLIEVPALVVPPGVLRTTVLTLDPLGVGDPGLTSPLSLDVVDPELTPLELCKTRLGEWWMFLVELLRVLKHPDLILPVPLKLALSKHKLEAKMDALTLCLLPNLTGKENCFYKYF